MTKYVVVAPTAAEMRVAPVVIPATAYPLIPLAMLKPKSILNRYG